VEHQSPAERILTALNAGVDQFGGESRPDLVVELIDSGRLPVSRLDQSVRRLLTEKFKLGLFDEKRYVDPEHARRTAGRADFRAAGSRAQSRSVTVLANGARPAAPQAPGDSPVTRYLPAPKGLRLFVQGVDPAAAAEYGHVVDDPGQADLGILRLSAPYEKRPGRFEALFHAGRLDFPQDRLGEILQMLKTVPTVVAIHLDRPAVIPEIAEAAGALLAVYGASDTALLDVVFGRIKPQGRLPFQLPRSVEDVLHGRPDVSREIKHPLFDFGHGLTQPEA
jgi:beta-glucosidase